MTSKALLEFLRKTPSFGPGIGIALVNIAEQTKKRLANSDLPEKDAAIIRSYCSALIFICRIAALQQGAIINELTRLTEDEHQ